MASTSLMEPLTIKMEGDNSFRKSSAFMPPFTLTFQDPALNFPAGTEEKFVSAELILGRGRDCHIMYGDEYPMVSRMHASVEWGNNNFYLRHLSATNQTLLNGRPISRKWFLEDGDIIQLASSGPKIKFSSPKNPFKEEVDDSGKKTLGIILLVVALVLALAYVLIVWEENSILFGS